ncbi:MAG: DUF4145 domain-containing protein [Candidatus Woesearchaeota archaeon]
MLIKRSRGSEKSEKEKVLEELKQLYLQLKELISNYEALHVYEIPKWIADIERLLNVPYSAEHKILLREIKEKMDLTKHSNDIIDINELKSLHIPSEIREEVIEDFKEAIGCYRSKHYKAAIILCARILETLLFRKYYDITGKDLLETSPNYGLGKLVAELRQLNQIDPAIMQQIHLINQVRIYSVHSKKEKFEPSDIQTKAILLYSYDLARKLYGSKKLS